MDYTTRYICQDCGQSVTKRRLCHVTANYITENAGTERERLAPANLSVCPACAGNYTDKHENVRYTIEPTEDPTPPKVERVRFSMPLRPGTDQS